MLFLCFLFVLGPNGTDISTITSLDQFDTLRFPCAFVLLLLLCSLPPPTPQTSIQKRLTAFLKPHVFRPPCSQRR